MKERYFRHLRCINRLLDTYGGEAFIVRYESSGPSYDPGPTVETLFPIVFLETGFTESESNDLVDTNGIAGHVRVSATVTPDNDDTFRLRGKDFSIKSLTPVQPSPDGELIIYTLRAVV